MNKQKCVDLYNKGKDLYIKKKYKSALNIFKSIELSCVGNFEEAIIHHYSALCYSNLHNLKQSIKEFNLAIKYKPNDIKIYLDTGLTYYFFYEKSSIDKLLPLLGIKNKLEKAIEVFEKGLLIDDKNPNLWYYRGYMQELLNKKEAKKSYKTALKYNKRLKNHEKSELFKKIKK